MPSDFPRFEESDASSRALVGGILLTVLILLGALLIIFRIVVGVSLDPLVFWPSIFVWGALAFLPTIRKTDPKKRARQIRYLFVVPLILALVASKAYPPLTSFALAFEGFFPGMGLYLLGVLLKRRAHSSHYRESTSSQLIRLPESKRRILRTRVKIL